MTAHTRDQLLNTLAISRLWLERCRYTIQTMEDDIYIHLSTINHVKAYALQHGIDLSEADDTKPVDQISPYVEGA